MGEFDKCSTDLTCEFGAQEEEKNPPIKIMLSAILGIAQLVNFFVVRHVCSD
jgi:hypothetical protein